MKSFSLFFFVHSFVRLCHFWYLATLDYIHIWNEDNFERLICWSFWLHRCVWWFPPKIWHRKFNQTFYRQLQTPWHTAHNQLRIPWRVASFFFSLFFLHSFHSSSKSTTKVLLKTTDQMYSCALTLCLSLEPNWNGKALTTFFDS